MIDYERDTDQITKDEALIILNRSYSSLRRYVKKGLIPEGTSPAPGIRYYSRKACVEFTKGRVQNSDKKIFAEQNRMKEEIFYLERVIKQEKPHKRHPKADEVKSLLSKQLQIMRSYVDVLQQRKSYIQY